MERPCELQIRRCRDEARMPAFAHPGDAGLDLCAAVPCTLKPFERAQIPTGLQVAIPAGHAGLVLPRSGNALKLGLTLVNTPGLIDSGYRGELKVLAINLDPETSITLEVGDRIAQLVVIAIPDLVIGEVGELDETQRGEAGLGSSGMR